MRRAPLDPGAMAAAAREPVYRAARAGCSTVIFVPELRPWLNAFFELAFDLLAACYLVFAYRVNRLYVRASALYLRLYLFALLHFRLRP